MESKKYESGGGVVIHEGKVLLLDRPKRGEIRLPKGHIDPGETPSLTALRETTEETGYADLEILAALEVQDVGFTYKGCEHLRTEHYFLMRLTGTTMSKRSKSDAKQFRPIWVDMDKATEMLTYKAEQEIVHQALRRFKQLHIA